MGGQFARLPQASINPAAGVARSSYAPDLGVPGFDGNFSFDDLPEAVGANVVTPLPNRVGEFPLTVQGTPKIEVKQGKRGVSFATGGSHGFQDETLRLATNAPRAVVGVCSGATDTNNRYIGHFGRYVIGSKGNGGWGVWNRDTASSTLPGTEQLALTGAASEAEVFFAWGAVFTPTNVRLTIMKHNTATLTGSSAATQGNQERFRFGSSTWGSRGFWTGMVRTWPLELSAGDLDGVLSKLSALYGIARPA